MSGWPDDGFTALLGSRLPIVAAPMAGAAGVELAVVVAYGRIIPEWMLNLPRWGNLNLHASLLPKYRGAAPIQQYSF